MNQGQDNFNQNNNIAIQDSNIMDNSQNFSNKPKNKKIPLIIGILFLLLIVIVIVLFVMGDRPKDELKDNNENSINDSNDNNGIDEEISSKIKSGNLDLYNDISDSNYLSVVVYDPLKDRQSSGDKSDYDKSLVITYDFGENIKDNFINNGFVTVAEESNSLSLKYYFGITNNKYVLYQATATTVLKDGSSWLGMINKKDDELSWFKDDSRNNVGTIDKNYSNQYYIYGSNWYSSHFDEIETDRISLIIGESSDKNIYVQMQLNNYVKFDNSFVKNVNNLVANNDFKNTLTILESTDDLNSSVNVYGKKIELDKTVFYQDLIATIISNQYGLNLRNKDYFVTTDTMYVKYRAYTEDDYLTEIVFDYSKKGYDYSYAQQKLSDDSFEYSYNGVKYSYFEDGQNIYVYKDEEFVGKLVITHRGKTPENIFGELNYLFGIKK